jgi:site-specific DNA-cytosine methylase
MTLINCLNPESSQSGRVYGVEGIAPALYSGKQGVSGNSAIKIARMVGRNIVDGKRKDITGAPTEQRLEANAQGISNCLTSVQKDNLVVAKTSVRRLTPTETEALQGWPLNHTQYGNYNGTIKPISDTQRYRLCGNGVSVPCVKAVATKLHPLYHQQSIPKAA